MDLINISNHPSDSQIKRKANRANIITEEHNAYELKYIILNVLVKHFKEDNGIDVAYPLIPDYVFTLRADNSTLVDPATGEYVDSSFPNAMGEAEYFIQVIAANAVAIDDLSEQMIARGDIYGRFNNYSIARIVTWMKYGI
jgi:hypothetical protein